MGQGISTMDALRKKEGDIIEYHTKIDTLYNQIKEKSNNIVNEIKKRQYNDPSLICQRIVWYNVDELLPFLKVQTVPTGSYKQKYKLGVKPESRIENLLADTKLKTCKTISEFYKLKIKVLTEMTQVPTCQNMAKLEYAQIRKLLDVKTNSDSSASDNIKKWGEIYIQLEKLNKGVIKLYTSLLSQMDNVRKSSSLRELGRLRGEILNDFEEIKKICQKHSSYFKTDNLSRKATATIETAEEFIVPSPVRSSSPVLNYDSDSDGANLSTDSMNDSDSLDSLANRLKNKKNKKDRKK